MVHQHTLTDRIPLQLPRGKSYINRRPHDLLSTRTHGCTFCTSAGCTTSTLWPVVNRPTTACSKLVFAGTATMPYTPEADCKRRKTCLDSAANKRYYSNTTKINESPRCVMMHFPSNVVHYLLVRKRGITPLFFCGCCSL